MLNSIDFTKSHNCWLFVEEIIDWSWKNYSKTINFWFKFLCENHCTFNKFCPTSLTFVVDFLQNILKMFKERPKNTPQIKFFKFRQNFDFDRAMKIDFTKNNKITWKLTIYRMCCLSSSRFLSSSVHAQAH